MFPFVAVFTFGVLASLKDGVGVSSLLGFLPGKTHCSAAFGLGFQPRKTDGSASSVEGLGV